MRMSTSAYDYSNVVMIHKSLSIWGDQGYQIIAVLNICRSWYIWDIVSDSWARRIHIKSVLSRGTLLLII